MKNIEVTVEEKLQLRDLVTSDTWKLIRQIHDNLHANAVESLMAVDEGKSFHKTQGFIMGIGHFIQLLEDLSLPPKTFTTDSFGEHALKARK